ncbi:glycine dehydrogenase (decarboxylating) alpha subunit /glycine dehydrogenase (decarboxylating) beta subunit [Asanoa ferruginea]|uniref:Glycine dehydrogenase (decarboxylating) n=1 Tax=Asanoa ferruginea TaxID=53367 RepID=A0A3D9ZU21_9ACTN|nr:aminomethyl-transferring glycine dehydrogenase [Asanoa ferruginea]REG00676.1 glycine dehydrogenase (decarboxylating) alpha subunit /glycine dehydrogenase (decarboxylating) beta subunit [Asanoa ferruginea]GIF47451.1 glycine dehydrogenase (decarboxylating) [Asanoa ferruginea]
MTDFADRHIGPDRESERRMLDSVGYGTVDELMDAAIPEVIRWHGTLDLPPAASEAEVIAELRALADRNTVNVSMIGNGYYGTHTPAVIRRNVLESPAWYTAYTPYQPEISQGRLEALLNFQTMVSDLTGLTTANASMLDEATAAAEAMTLARRASKTKSPVYVVDADTLPQTLAVIEGRAEPLGITVLVTDLSAGPAALPAEFFGLHLQYPGASGAVRDHSSLVAAAHEAGALVAVAADLLALTLLRSPGEIGADIAAGTTQRFGVPMGFGGPHAGYLAVRAGLERMLPGRLVGVSRDADGAPAYRLALQTREQHIRREKATSNICTAQVLLAVIASMYAVYHGPDGLRSIARHAHSHAARLAAGLRAGGVSVADEAFFDTVTASVPGRAFDVVAAAASRGVNLRLVDADRVAIACDETTVAAHLSIVWEAFGVPEFSGASSAALPSDLARTSDFLTHPVFHEHRSETAMLRYLRRLSDLDYALDRGMIPLGSCTMKLNATTEMEPISWPEFANIHPHAPASQTAGYRSLISSLETWLAEVTGYDAVSVQPNAGSQGELAGLLAIRGYHRSRGDLERDVCLIPSSAHGTNAASAVMAGMRVVVVACDDEGNVDLVDLDAKIAAHASRLAAIMVTYPSTHGVYETGIASLCAKVHDAGGQVYVDGANLNALVGFAKPGKFGADVSHLNLHKTFCIPHGGGGPGVGPIGVRAHLSPFLPGDPLGAGADSAGVAVSAAQHGSAGILPIPWAYLRMMGAEGLARATGAAVLAANYVAVRLREHYPVLYSGNKGLVAHECILDLRPLTKATGVSVDDVAKRLIDYGFHAPTMSFPVAGTLMVEPTESEDLAELDRFCDAMIAIREEITKVGSGTWPRDDNPLANAPHTAAMVSGDEWSHAYPRSVAAYPFGVSRVGKYWSPVRRIDGAFGDRNLVCACPPPEAFE